MTRAIEPTRGLFGVLAVAVVTLVFGDFAHDVAQWIACSRKDQPSCDEKNATDTIMVATLASTLVAIAIAALAVPRGGQSSGEARGLIITALVAAYLSLVKATVGEAGYPQFGLLGAPTVIFLVIASVILTIMSWTAPFLSTPARRFTLLATLCCALLLSGAVGGLLTHVAETSTGERRKHILRIVAPIMATAAFAILFRAGARSRGWLRFWLCFAIAAALAYTWLVYVPEQSGANRWLAQPTGKVWLHAFAYAGILLAGVLGCWVAIRFGGPHPGWALTLAATGLAVAIAAGCAAWLDQAIRASVTSHDLLPTPWVLLLHGSGPVIGAALAPLTCALIRRFGRRKARARTV